MKRSATPDRWFQPVLVATIFVMLTAGLAGAQAKQRAIPPSYAMLAAMQDQTHPSSSQSQVQGTFPALLTKSLDSKKLKEGDQVVCQTPVMVRMQSGMIIPTGTKVVGHVTQAQARSKGDAQSSLGIAFDKIMLEKNEELPIKGVLQAVGPSLGDTGPQTGPATPGTGLAGRGSGGGTVAPPSAGVYGGYDPKSTRILTKETTGVLGYKGLEMDDKHVITSSGKEVKLDSGSQIMIRAE